MLGSRMYFIWNSVIGFMVGNKNLISKIIILRLKGVIKGVFIFVFICISNSKLFKFCIRI